MTITWSKWQIVFLFALFSTLLVGCKDSTPPYYGGFLKKGSNYVDVPELELFGMPTEGELVDVPITSDSQPVFVLWYPEIRLDYLEFFSVSEDEQVRFSTDPKDEGILEFRPTDPLDPGYYCFIQGDPLGVFLPGWCFLVE